LAQRKVAGEGMTLVCHESSLKLLQFFSRFSAGELKGLVGEKSIRTGVTAVEITPLGQTSKLPFSVDGELISHNTMTVELVTSAIRIFKLVAEPQVDALTKAI
jgi:diacylglycerol kinase family enzyme